MQQGKYIETRNTTQSQLKNFQDFIYRHFKKSEHYDQMRPVSNQPGRFFATAKTPKFTNTNADTNANYEDVSFDVESLFTSIPVAETIEYILERIYTNKE